ncbi:hypothetical protein BK784_35540 [Bacillus thuringiensis serovar medellin]|uniref:Toll/interleukin-1 receptor domain-containing protein n=1 Tax=Bacillus thuringiensis subsp. medellin TaxID=79672 RepID=A0A9X6MY20_BACTV|nr:toll/interleukin-1 receptor domain-containing protein [Bacillus thuringiensis]OUB84495.1 hypothetical protein BK784_35540 [Bacillus thuringiensis serovar medellin]
MFAGFNLTTDTQFKVYQEIGNEIFLTNKKNFIEELETYIDKDGNIDGSGLQANWFPQMKADIFISHSHKDEDKAKGLAGWLYKEFGLTTFIDSCVWGYSIDLLRQIDESYCLNEDKSTFNYNKRNYSTSHVHMMLAIALTMMIDKVECIMFLNTPNAVCSKEVINKTESPWIYYETVMTNLVRHKKLSEYRKEFIQKAIFNEQKSLNIKYDVDLKHLYELNQEELEEWKALRKGIHNDHPLDTLYRKMGIIK